MMPLQKLIAFAFFASLSTVALLPVFELGSDVLMHQVLLECFSSQLWAGDLYPRWCVDANAGMGTPYLISYYPLSYYIGAIFWPLTWLGVSLSSLYLLLVVVCGVVTFLTAWYWLRDICGERNALLCAFLYLWLPYRMEVTIFRASYPEMWLLAMLPLLLLAVRQFLQHRKLALFYVAIITAACLMTQVPTTLCVLFICGIYVIAMVGFDVKKLLQFGAAMLAAGLMAMVYVMPASHYAQFLSEKMAEVQQLIWVCRYVLLMDIVNLLFLVLNLFVVCLLLVVFSLRIYVLRAMIAEPFVRKETCVLFFCGLLAAFMLFPVSAPIWDVWRAFGIPAMPWRMHAVVGTVLIYMLAINMHWLTDSARFKIRTGDYRVLAAFLMLLALPLHTEYTQELKDLAVRISKTRAIQFPEHYSRWATKETRSLEYVTETYDKHGDKPRAHLKSGDASIKDVHWNAARTEFGMHVSAKRKSTIVLAHYYYPIWKAADANGASLTLAPDKDGMIQLDVEKGEHAISLERNIYTGNALLEWCRQISAAALLLWGVLFWRASRIISSKA